jgi:hypothetical protein
MPDEDDETIIAAIAKRRGVSRDAVATALAALRRGGGRMAQFSHSEFGGMAQWVFGGMSMIGDMFNSQLKATFEGVMADLADALRSGSLSSGRATHGSAAGEAMGSGQWWPAEFGSPSSVGSQNSVRYAFFPKAHRLVIEEDGKRSVYDTGSHRISGVSLQQHGSRRSLAFHSQHGPVRLDELTRLD